MRALRPLQQVLQSTKSLQLLLAIAQVFSEQLRPLHQVTRIHVVNRTRTYKQHVQLDHNQDQVFLPNGHFIAR